jgi:two-component system sensor kinase FixL
MTGAWRSGAGVALRGVGFVALYVALDWISFIHAFSPLGITPWNPPPGLSLALFIRRGLGYAPWLFVAAIAADVVVRGLPAPLHVSVVSAAIIAAGYAGAGWVLRRVLHLDPALDRLRDVLALFGAGIVAALGVALLQIAVFAAAGLLPWKDFADAALRFWVGDVIGIAVVTPFLLRATGPRLRDFLRLDRMRAAEIALQVATLCAVLGLIFGVFAEDAFKFFYLLFLPVIWLAVRHGIDGAAAGILLAQIGLIVAIQSRDYGAETVTEFQILMLALSFTGLLIGAVVTERRRAQQALSDSERRLRERQDELAQFARARAIGEMASSLAHELSQPLTAAATYIGACRRLLAAPDADRARLVDAIDKAERQTKRAGEVLAGLRDFLYRGETHLAPLSIGAIIDSVAALAAPEADRLGVALVRRNGAGDARVLVDRVQIEQALLNLVRNGMEAIMEAGVAERRIEICSRADDRSVEGWVADTGGGVAEEVAERLFHPFVTTKEHGMGLGLTITRSIFEAHGGRLWFEPGETGGSVFRFMLPRGADA